MSLKTYIVINFKIYKTNQNTCKLFRIPTIIIKKNLTDISKFFNYCNKKIEAIAAALYFKASDLLLSSSSTASHVHSPRTRVGRVVLEESKRRLDKIC